MKILVIGGSYFYGRVFVMEYAKEHEITVVNRGTYSMKDFGAAQVTGDRRQKALWQGLCGDYDVIVDFCAYEKGDVETVLYHLQGRVTQYILISTVDVYQRGGDGPKREDAPFEKRHFPGEAGRYIAGKTALEEEERRVCAERGVKCTVLRPAILYGPYNYAPREAWFIRLAVEKRMLPCITDAAGRFQFVYVKDAAQAVSRCMLNERSYGQAYTLCQDEIVDYPRFFDALRKAAGEGLAEIPLTVSQAQEKGILLPFPVTEEETQLYSNEKSKEELGMKYLDFQEGMNRTYRAFRGVYGQRK